MVMTNMTKLDHAIHGKTHDFDWAIFSSSISHYQRGTLMGDLQDPIQSMYGNVGHVLGGYFLKFRPCIW